MNIPTLALMALRFSLDTWQMLKYKYLFCKDKEHFWFKVALWICTVLAVITVFVVW